MVPWLAQLDRGSTRDTSSRSRKVESAEGRGQEEGLDSRLRINRAVGSPEAAVIRRSWHGLGSPRDTSGRALLPRPGQVPPTSVPAGSEHARRQTDRRGRRGEAWRRTKDAQAHRQEPDIAVPRGATAALTAHCLHCGVVCMVGHSCTRRWEGVSSHTKLRCKWLVRTDSQSRRPSLRAKSTPVLRPKLGLP